MKEEAVKHTPPTQTTSPKLEPSQIRYDSDKIYSKISEIHGIGVFAREKILSTNIIEVFPIIPLSFRTSYQGDSRVIEYSVVKQCDCEECKRHGYVIFLRLGYGGLYNHQDNYNAEIIMDYTNMIGTCRAISNIDPNEEIFINYGMNYRFPNGKVMLKK